MDALTQLAMEFVRNFSKTIRAFRIYSPQHKQAQTSLTETFTPLQKMLGMQTPVILGAREGVLIVQGKPVRDNSPAVRAFCDMLGDRHLSTFAVQRGVTFEEFTHLVTILSKKSEELLEGNSVKAEHLKPLKNVRINEMKFVAVDDGVSEENIAAAAAAGGASIAELTKLVESLTGGKMPGAEQEGAAGIQALGAAMAPMMGEADQGKAVQAAALNFDRIVEQVMTNIPASQFVDEYLKGIDALPEPVRRALVGAAGKKADGDSRNAMIERLPLSMRGRLLANDLNQGKTDPDQLRKEVARIAPDPDEFVQILEIVSRLVKESGGTPDDVEKRLAGVFDLLPLSGEAKVERRTLFLMVRDRSELETYANTLEEAGYAVTPCRVPDTDLPLLLQAGAFDGMIIDVTPYQLTQLKFLKTLPEGTTLPPLFYLEDVTRMRSQKEMDFVPDGRFIYKPLTPDELLEVIRNAVPGAAEPAPPPAPEELERALQIQHQLAPRELPVIPGYSVAARFEPGRATGGNYHDIIALPDKQFGLLLMDVTGSRAAGILALAAARSNVRTIARQSANPVQTLARLNELLTGEIPRGTFVRALYAVLDPILGKLTVAGGGLPRPLRWNDESPDVKVLQLTGIPLGLAGEKAFESTLRAAAVKLSPGDHVTFYTHAVPRVSNDEDRPLGERGVALAMRSAPKGPAGLALVEIVEAVLNHRGESNPDADDFTVLELRREPEPDAARAS